MQVESDHRGALVLADIDDDPGFTAANTGRPSEDAGVPETLTIRAVLDTYVP